MEDNVAKKSNMVNLILLIIGIVLLIYTISQAVVDYLKEQKAVEVNATITLVNPNNIFYSADVKYEVEGEMYENKNVNLGFDKSKSVGDQIKIKYDINNPKILVQNNHILIIIVTGVLSLILLVMTIPNRIKITKRSIRINTLQKEGTVIDATIQDIIVDNKGKKHNGYYPYRLRARYTNPADNSTYLFESENTYYNINEVITNYQIKTVKVYVDKKTFANYYVYLPSLIPDFNLTNPREFMSQFYISPSILKKKEEPKPEENPEGQPTEEKKEETKS